MILSVSRRSDIPSFYSQWFFNRLDEGYLYTRNPMNYNQIRKINLSKDVIDGIVFWTKNPIPMLSNLDKIKDIPYYFQFTLNAYGKDVEPNVPSKSEFIIPAFIKLSNLIGKDRVLWRYDPILFSNKYTFDYHKKYFEELCKKLCDYTNICTVSFIEPYKKTQKNTKSLNLVPISSQEKLSLLTEFSIIAKKYNLTLQTCAQKINYEHLGIHKAKCIDKEVFEKINGFFLDMKKDKNQRLECGCVESIDIGTYNTCNNACLYCYANFNENAVMKNLELYDINSPILCSKILEGEVIKERKVLSFKNTQLELK